MSAETSTKTSSKITTKAVAHQPSFFISQILGEAWSIFKKEWLKIMALFLFPMLIGFIYLYVGGERPPLSLALAYLVVQFILSMMMIKGIIVIARKEKLDFEVLISVLPNLLKYVVGSILLGLIVFGGFILLILTGLIWSIKFMFVPYLLIDIGLGPIEALKVSSKMTDGIKWDIVGFYFAVIIMMYLGFFGLIVGIFVTMPIGIIAFVVLYNQLLKRAGVKISKS